MNERLVGRDLLAQVDDLIGPDLAEVEQIFRRELEGREPCVRDVFAHVSRFRGKRLRPMLVLLAARAAGRTTREHLVLAAVVEMIHTATLVHDDVLDGAETRRHVATVNARWNNQTSVLFGDYLFTHAFHLASSLDTTYACRLIGRATNIVCEGELAQIHERGNLELDEDRYLEIIGAKTAELCALCCRLGAHSAGAEAGAADALERYGRSLGVAFQITDDILDLLGTEAETGKSLGTDLEQQKMTLPLIRLLASTPEPDSSRVRELLLRPGGESWSELQRLLERSDAIEYATARAAESAAEACLQLAVLEPTPARAILEAVTEFAVRRSF
ncbi:MAG TPA: polyprenyl synthetase family protein [Planctomycetaceae bacterium]|nr:polyprenyl synthetase family protein [Planctomycetaceae bacterium]